MRRAPPGRSRLTMIPVLVRPLLTSFGGSGDNESANGVVPGVIGKLCYLDPGNRAEDDEEPGAAHELSVSEIMVPIKSDLER